MCMEVKQFCPIFVILAMAQYRNFRSGSAFLKMFPFLAGLLLAALVTSNPEIDTDTFCDGRADGYYCASCLQVAYCDSASSPPATLIQECPLFWACEQFAPTLASCIDSYNSPNATCACVGSLNFCDPYTETYIDTCSSPYTSVVKDCGETSQVCFKDECMFPPSCAGVADGTYVHYTPDCAQGFQCQGESPGTAVECEEGQYLSDDGTCTGPPEPCANSCSGNCPDVNDCSQYYFCDGAGTVLSGPIRCPTDDTGHVEYFNPNSIPPMCVANDTSVCEPLTECDF